jgi:hypothetical protein
LGTELVLLDLEGELPFMMARNATTGDQIEQALFVQLSRPTDGHL